MLKTYVIGGASDLVKQDLTSKLANFGLGVIGHLDYEKARGGGARKTLPSSAQVIVISDMINHSCSTNYVKEAKRRGIYHLLLPRKTSFWPKVIEQLIPLNERKTEVVNNVVPTPSSITPQKPKTLMLASSPLEETWIAALKAIPEFITLIKTTKEINTVIEVVANDYNVPSDELQQRWNEVAGKSVIAIRAVSKLPNVNSKVLADMFGIKMSTAAAYLAHASRIKGSQRASEPPSAKPPSAELAQSRVQSRGVNWCSIHQHYKPCEHNRGVIGSSGYYWPSKPSKKKTSPLIGQPRPLPVLPPLPPPIPPSQRPIVSIETLTVSGKLRDIQHLQRILQALQKSGQISRGLLIQR